MQPFCRATEVRFLGHCNKISKVRSSKSALIPKFPMRDGIYELSKMAVSPHLRGRGIGRRLL